MSTLVTIASSDLITNSRADINSNFSALNTDKIETSVLDTDTTLAANSDAKVATQKAVKAYVDAGGNVNASTTTKGIVEEATAAEVVARTAAGGTGARLFINPSTISSMLKFGGDGTDGALSISSGTTTLDMAGAVVFVKNYTSISITGTGALAFSNPAAGGTKIILKSQGAVTLTSSATPMIDGRSLGGNLGTGGSNASGNPGTASGSPMWVTNLGGGASKGSAGGTAGALPSAKANSAYFVTYYDPYQVLAPGAGGGGGAGEAGGSVGGDGGRGGGALIIECAGALNFTTTGGISVSGGVGSNGTGTTAGGGGGGGGGMCLILYGSLTAASGTITSAGGVGGTAVSSGANAYGGGGGGSASNVGVAGILVGSAIKDGGDGGAGLSLIVANTQCA